MAKFSDFILWGFIGSLLIVVLLLFFGGSLAIIDGIAKVLEIPIDVVSGAIGFVGGLWNNFIRIFRGALF